MNIVICVDETSAGSFGDAAWGVKRFRELGHRIIITGRTDGAYADACKITAGEEPENTGKMDPVLIGDRISDCAGAAARGIPAIVFNSKDNREEETELLRADNWAEKQCSRSSVAIRTEGMPKSSLRRRKPLILVPGAIIAGWRPDARKRLRRLARVWIRKKPMCAVCCTI